MFLPKPESVLVGRLAVLSVDLSDQIDEATDEEVRQALIHGLGQVVLHLDIVKGLDAARDKSFVHPDQVSLLRKNATEVANLGDSMLQMVAQGRPQGEIS